MKTYSSKKTVGYLVTTVEGRTKTLGYKNVTWLNHYATLFPTYDAARNAIGRTNTYSQKHGYHWPEMKITRVVSA